MNIPDFIEQLVEADIEVVLRKGGKFYIKGFYKSSGITVQWDSVCWVATARYNEVSQIDNMHDLVCLNYSWWQRSKDRFDGWSQPESAWVPLLLKFGYIKEKTIPAQTVYE
jgi:hypothetical protein